MTVMKSLADAFELSTETLLEQAGILDDEEGPSRGSEVVRAIRADVRLTPTQKKALLSVYSGFVGPAEAAAGERAAR